MWKEIIGQLAYYQISRSYSKKFLTLWNLPSRNYSVVFEKAKSQSFVHAWKMETAIDKGKYFGALLIDLSKAFDCLSHELFLVKLRTYGFSLVALDW